MAAEVKEDPKQEDALRQFSSLVDEQLKYMESRLNYLGFLEKIVSHEKKQLELYKNQKYVSNINQSQTKSQTDNRV